MKTRREFLTQAPLGLLGAVVASRTMAQTGEPAMPPGSPPAFNTAPAVGPKLTTSTFAEAEKLQQVAMTEAQHSMAVGSWPTSMAGLLERRAGPN